MSIKTTTLILFILIYIIGYVSSFYLAIRSIRTYRHIAYEDLIFSTFFSLFSWLSVFTIILYLYTFKPSSNHKAPLYNNDNCSNIWYDRMVIDDVCLTKSQAEWFNENINEIKDSIFTIVNETDEIINKSDIFGKIDDNYVNTFTDSELLEMLPENISVKGSLYRLCIEKLFGQYIISYLNNDGKLIRCKKVTLRNALFGMFKLLKKYEFI